jgi:hypothetical protein
MIAIGNHPRVDLDARARPSMSRDAKGPRPRWVTLGADHDANRTGKTDVIATMATALPEVQGPRLVLTAWNALVVQLIDSLRERFWRNNPTEMSPAFLPLKRLPRSSQLHSLADEQ